MSWNSRSKLNFSQSLYKLTHTKLECCLRKTFLNQTQRAVRWNDGRCVCSLVSLPFWNWIFVTHPLTLAVSTSPGKGSVPILEVPCILSISPGDYSTPAPYWIFLIFYLKCFLCLRSQHLLCDWDKSQSHPQSLQMSWPPKLDLTFLPWSTHRFTWSSMMVAWVGPFSFIANWLLIWSSLSATEIADPPSSKATATRWQDASPLRRRSPWFPKHVKIRDKPPCFQNYL
jgi:hypothetical protein